MEKLQVHLVSQAVELSEYKTYFELVNRVCFYTSPNLNGVLLPAEGALEKAQTLINAPVQAKYTVNAKGEPDLLDHCVTIDENGDYQFGTVSIGTHTAVEIKDDTVTLADGTIATVPCLFATLRIWKRYANYCAAVIRLFEAGRLHNSWEISSFAYTYESGVRTLTDYVFEGNCLLGEGVPPAYGDSAEILSLVAAHKESERMVASALSQDLMSGAGDEDIDISTGKEDGDLDKVDEIVVEDVSADDTGVDVAEVPAEGEQETSVETPPAEVEEAETAALTMWDLRWKLTEACRAKIDKWCWVSYLFPEEHVCWCEYEDSESELDYLLFTYAVENDAVTVGEPQKVKLTVSVAAINATLEEKNDAIIEANKKIEKLESDVEALSAYRDKYEAAQREAQETELRDYAKDSGCFTEDEITGEEISALISALDKAGLKSLVADRLVEKQRADAKVVKETASVNPPAHVKADLSPAVPEIDLVDTVRSVFK